MLVSYRTLANTSAVVETREESVGLGESGLSRMAKAGRRARVRAAQSLRGRNRAVAQGPNHDEDDRDEGEEDAVDVNV